MCYNTNSLLPGPFYKGCLHAFSRLSLNMYVCKILLNVNEKMSNLVTGTAIRIKFKIKFLKFKI